MKTYQTIRDTKNAMGYVGPTTRPACANCSHVDIRRWAAFSKRIGDHTFFCQLGGMIVAQYGYCRCFAQRLEPAQVRDVKPGDLSAHGDCHA